MIKNIYNSHEIVPPKKSSRKRRFIVHTRAGRPLVDAAMMTSHDLTFNQLIINVILYNG